MAAVCWSVMVWRVQVIVVVKTLEGVDSDDGGF